MRNRLKQDYGELLMFLREKHQVSIQEIKEIDFDNWLDFFKKFKMFFYTFNPIKGYGGDWNYKNNLHKLFIKEQKMKNKKERTIFHDKDSHTIIDLKDSCTIIDDKDSHSIIDLKDSCTIIDDKDSHTIIDLKDSHNTGNEGKNEINKKTQSPNDQINALVQRMDTHFQTFNKTIGVLNKTIEDQGKTIGVLNRKIKDQDKVIVVLNRKIEAQDKTIGVLDEKLEENGG